ncbi:MAG: alpha/beta hydrolase [Anaerolineales bacterium]|nr:alpha/beta hydrolase [Anaerolineae bacterium]PWB71021.1 MAG: alpha/beta hydrolase [Anaerolineales bacterium]
MELEHNYIETNGIKLHVVQAGPQSGVPVVLLHGFPEFWYGWRKQIPALVKEGCRVIVPDQRGYNLSDKPRGVKAYRMQELVNDMAGLVDALGYEKVNLVGHDWGGIVAWILGNKYPERLHKLGIMNAPHPAVMRKNLLHNLDQIRRSWYAILFQLPWIPEAGMRRDNWRGAERALRGSGKVHTFTSEDMVKYKEAWSQPGAMTAMINWYRAWVRNPGLVPNDMRIKIPTLMMWGMKDFALSHRMARPSMDYVNEGNLMFFPEATHWVQHDAADEVNHYLADFIFDKAGQMVIR